jgi:hypothetical protein
MRDLLSKLDGIVKETALNPKDPKGDYQAKSQALDDLEQDPIVSADPELSAAVDQRRADLEKEAESAGVLEVGDAFGISFNEDFEIETEIAGFLEDGIVIDLDETAISYLQENGISFLDGELQEGLRDPKDNPCWKGYKPVGTKKKNGRTVPNCVPKESIEDTNEGTRPHPKELEMDAKVRSMGIQNRADAAEKKLAAKKDEPKTLAQKVKKDIGDPLKKLVKGDFKGALGESDVDEAEYHGKNVPLGKKLPGDVKKSKVYVRKPNGKVVKVNFGDKKMRIKKSNPARRKSFRARHNCKNPGPRWKARYWSCRSW